MSKISIIIAREFTTRIKKKSFILLTLLLPFLSAVIIFVPVWLGSVKGDDSHKIVVVDKTAHYLPAFVGQNPQFVVVPDTQMREAYRSDTTDVEAVLIISDDLCKKPDAVTLYSQREIQPELQMFVEGTIREQVRRDKLEAYNVEGLDQIINDVQTDVAVQTVKWQDNGEESMSSGTVAMVAGFIFTFLIYMFVMIYGAMVMQSVMEEKTNRIVEIMVSSVRPFELMMGKIIAIALVGLTQMLIWGLMLALILGFTSQCFGTDGGVGEMLTPLLHLPYGELSVMFLLCFIGGYLLYASFFSAIGAAINEPSDSSQFMMPVTIILVFAMYAAMGSAENTDGPLAFWTSLFPLTSPIVMMVRVPFGVPLWQEVLCIVLLFATALLFVWMAARIYRVGILMYGKKPSLREMWKWLRYK